MTLYYSNIENKKKRLNSYNPSTVSRQPRRLNNELNNAPEAAAAFSSIEDILGAPLDPSGGGGVVDLPVVVDVPEVPDVPDEVTVNGGKKARIPPHIRLMNGMIQRNFKPISDDLTKRHAIIIKRLNKIENLIIAILCILILIALKIYS